MRVLNVGFLGIFRCQNGLGTLRVKGREMVGKVVVRQEEISRQQRRVDR
jgi:hypothetical protein